MWGITTKIITLQMQDVIKPLFKSVKPCWFTVVRYLLAVFCFFLFDWLVTNTHLERRSEKQLFLEWHLILSKEMCQGIKKVTVERKHCRVWWFGSAEMENETSPCLREKILPETELSTRVTENRIFRIIYYEYIYWEKESDIITFAYELGFCPMFSCQDKSDEAVLLSCLEQPWGLWVTLLACCYPKQGGRVNPFPALQEGSDATDTRHFLSCLEIPEWMRDLMWGNIHW